MTDGKLRVKSDTITRTIVLFVALINQVIVLFGGDALPFDDNQIYSACSTILTVGASLRCWWKNNSFTTSALKADLKLNMHKRDLAAQRARRD